MLSIILGHQNFTGHAHSVTSNCILGKTNVDCGYILKRKRGRPIGTTADAGFNVSGGRKSNTFGLVKNSELGDKLTVSAPICTTNGSSVPQEVLSQSNKFNLFSSSYVEDQLSLSDELMARAQKRIAQQIRFDCKPLAIGMCYCCGSILWSRVDNSHTNLVDIELTENQIPAVAYQKS